MDFSAMNQDAGMLWPGGLNLALTFSYDDGIEQDVRLIELMDRYGIRSTFNLNSGLMGQQGNLGFMGNVAHNKLPPDQIAEVYKNHEVACHGHMHEALPALSSTQALREILCCRDKLEHLVHHPVVGHAYAIGPYDDKSEVYLEQCGITYARTTEETEDFLLPKNFYYWHPTCHHGNARLFELVHRFFQEESMPFLKRKLLYIWGHSYEFDAENNWDRIERLFQMTAHREDVWYCTNGEVVQYVTAFRRLVRSADGAYLYNPSCQSVWITTPSSGIVQIPAGKTVVLGK